MPILIATAGATDANTYATDLEMETYLENRLYITNFTGKSAEEVESALVWGTRLLDDLCNWDGIKVTDAQALRWPRSFVYDPDGDLLLNTTIPTWLRDAASEFALHLLGDEDLTAESNRDLVGVKEIAISSLKLKVSETAKKGMIPPSVWIMIRQYCTRVGGGTKRLVRV